MRRHAGILAVAMLLIGAAWYSTRHRIDLDATSTIRAVIVDGNTYMQWIAEGGTGSATPTWEEIAPDVTESAESSDSETDHSLDWCDASTPPKATGQPEWRLPRIHKYFCSPIGTLWTVILPIWFLAVVALLLPAFGPALVRRLTSLRGNSEMDGVRRKWLLRCLVIFTGLLAMWIASLTFWVGGSTGTHDHFSVTQGVVEVEFASEPVHGRFDGEAFLSAGLASIDPYYFWPEYTFSLPHTAFHAQSSVGVWTAVVLPLWPLPAISLILAALLYRKPNRSGLCRKCRYDLTGNQSGRCPECGWEIDRKVR